MRKLPLLANPIQFHLMVNKFKYLLHLINHNYHVSPGDLEVIKISLEMFKHSRLSIRTRKVKVPHDLVNIGIQDALLLRTCGQPQHKYSSHSQWIIHCELLNSDCRQLQCVYWCKTTLWRQKKLLDSFGGMLCHLKREEFIYKKRLLVIWE